MNTNDDIALHELEVIERTMSGEAAETEAEGGFMVVSGNGFMVVSGSGFMVV